MSEQAAAGGGRHRPPRMPVTHAEEYLAAILAELRTLNTRLAAPAPVEGETVELKEPAKKPRGRPKKG